MDPRKPIQFVIKLDNRRTHLHGDPAAIIGLTTGFSYHQKFRYLIGINYTPTWSGQVIAGQSDAIQSKLLWIGLGEEIDFWQHKRFTATTYAKMGYGRHLYRQQATSTEPKISIRQNIAPVELGMYGSMSLCPWMALRLGGGWRWVIWQSPHNLSNYFIKMAVAVDVKKLREV